MQDYVRYNSEMKKNHEWKEPFTKSNVTFLVLVAYHKLLPCRVWCP